MPETYTVTSRQGYLSRIGGSLKGILVGLLMFLVGFPVLFWNEGRAVQTRKSLDEGAGAVVTAQSTPRDAALDGRLVHLSGDLRVDTPVSDPRFGIERQVVRLQRDVEMFQWRERSETREEKRLGGSVERITTYSYSREWSSEAIDSSRFAQPAGRQNPASMPFESTHFAARTAQLGDYRVGIDLMRQLSGTEALPVAPEDLAADLQTAFVRHGEWLVQAANPGSPEIGDLRVRFRVVPEQRVSVVARQNGDSLDAYPTRAGDALLMMRSGDVAADTMFADAHAANQTLTWALRLAGFMLMWLGLGLVFKPLSVLMDVIPLLGTVVGKGIGFVTFVVAAALALVTIGIAWVFYRPLLGIAILVVAGALIYALKARRTRPAPSTPQPEAPAMPG